MNTEKQKIALAGFGLEGRAAYEYFKGRAEIHIFDEKKIDATGLDATVHTGLTIPSEFPLVYKTPGIPTRKLVLQSPDTRISTLMDLVLEKVGSRTIGITGTKGKSTTTALIQHILASAGKDALFFGNIGVADMALLESDSPEKIYVTELSSYQCEHLAHSPHVAVFTNFYPEHLSHHGSFEAYKEAKLNLFSHQTSDDFFINGSDLQVTSAGKEVTADFTERFETKLLGEHNQKNCALALAAVQLFGVSKSEALEHIKTFEPLPYRIENIGTHKGITFYDDSLATIPEATLATISALPRVDTIILGGEDRGISFDAFAHALAKTTISTFVAFPDTGKKMIAEVGDRTIVETSTMEEAVRAAFAHTPAGGTVLLSTASPSYNLFVDYKDRSAQYRKWIKELSHEL